MKYKDILAAGISPAKAKIICDKLEKVGDLLNSIEVDLKGTNIKEKLLVPDREEPTLWTQIFNIEMMFRNRQD